MSYIRRHGVSSGVQVSHDGCLQEHMQPTVEGGLATIAAGICRFSSECRLPQFINCCGRTTLECGAHCSPKVAPEWHEKQSRHKAGFHGSRKSLFLLQFLAPRPGLEP